MNQVDREEAIQAKLSGKYESLMPVYEKLRDELFKIGTNIKITLKPLYMRIEFDSGSSGMVYWKDDYLEVLLPTDAQDEKRLLNAKHYKIKGLDKMVRLTTVDDIDDYLVDLLSGINEDQVFLYVVGRHR